MSVDYETRKHIESRKAKKRKPKESCSPAKKNEGIQENNLTIRHKNQKTGGSAVPTDVKKMEGK